MSFEDFQIPCTSHGVSGLRAYFKISIVASVMCEFDFVTRCWPNENGGIKLPFLYQQ